MWRRLRWQPRQWRRVMAAINNQLSNIKNGSKDDIRSVVAAVSRGRQCDDGCGDGQGNGGGRWL